MKSNVNNLPSFKSGSSLQPAKSAGLFVNPFLPGNEKKKKKGFFNILEIDNLERLYKTFLVNQNQDDIPIIEIQN